LTAACPTCGTTNEPAAKFCGECGASLAERATTRTVGADSVDERDQVPAVPSFERRLVSVLFADLVGFTTLSESRDAEDVRELLARYFDTSKGLISRYGGVVEKFIGDAVMAVWGTPVANEDDAERAVRAGLELAAAVAELGEEVGASALRARVGVLTGEAAVNLFARDQGMVAGDLVNTASRIQSAAEPGAVFVGEATRRATEAAIAYEDVGSFVLKGKAEPVPLWRADRVVGLIGGVMRSPVLEPPFVGRDRELRLMKEVFHGTVDESHAHLVSVMGVGGIGKSRLSWEFEKYIDGLALETWWHRGRCLAYGDGVAFWALAEMVRMRAGILEDEAPSSASAKLRAAVDRHLPDPSERRFVEPRLAQLLGLEDRPSGDQENLLSAWRTFFERLSETMPVILVFEDIHWADSALIDFIEYLLDWSRERPIFVLTLARPDLLDRRPTWGAGKRAFTSIPLEPLTTASMEQLLVGPLPGLPDELRTKILDRAEGVPFYAVETVRMLLDRGLIVRDGDAYRPTGPIDTLEVPETLQALIAARLDGLEPQERLLVQDASVLGKSFTVAGLVATTGRPAEELEPLLASLVRKEVVAPTADPMSPERGQYAFLQDLVKVVAYDTMSKRERKRRHLASADHLIATTDEDDVIEVVAAHLVDAYRAEPNDDDAQEIKRRARLALIRAGDRAASLGARAEARRHFEQASELSVDPLEAAALLERAGIETIASGQVDDGIALLGRALDDFESLGATHPAARVTARIGEQLWNRGKSAQAIDMMERAYSVLAEEEPDADLATLAAQLARFHFFAGGIKAATDRLEVALDLAEAYALPELLSETLNTKGVIAAANVRLHEAIALIRSSLDIALENESPSAALRAYYNLTDSLMNVDDVRASVEMLREGLTYARRVGNRIWEAGFAGQTYGLYVLGEWDEILALRSSVADMDPEMFRAFNSSVGLMTLLHLQRGDLEAAREAHRQFPGMETSDDVQERSFWLLGRAALALTEGDHEDALAIGRSLLAVPELGAMAETSKEGFVVSVEAAIRLEDPEAGNAVLKDFENSPPGRRSRYIEAHDRRFRARLSEVAEAADALFAEAVDRFDAIEAGFWGPATQLERTERLVAEGRPEEARSLLEMSRPTLERLSARPWLERADALEAALGDH
jgi:class 3 adenylate cyclase/tetratricopeptide (TPR) repeat protein